MEFREAKGRVPERMELHTDRTTELCKKILSRFWLSTELKHTQEDPIKVEERTM